MGIGGDRVGVVDGGWTMTPVEQVQEWLTAIGKKTYDAEHREALKR